MNYVNYLIKGYNRLLKLFKVILDLILFIILTPLYAVLVLYLAIVGRNSKKQKKAIFCGLEHVIQKTLFRANDLQRKGFLVKYYSYEKTNNSLAEAISDIIKIRPLMSLDIIYFMKQIYHSNPIYVEMYFEGSGFRQVFYSLISRLYGSVVVSIFRGGELRYFVKRERTIKTYLCFISANLSHTLMYRELYMKEFVDKFLLSAKKAIHDYNRVRIKELSENSSPEKVILFLNTLKEVRRPEILIKAFPLILKLHPDAKLLMVGAQHEAAYEKYNQLLDDLQIKQNSEILPWTSTPQKYYDSCSVFVLPADLVYCNYSLLECMERGVPAVVANVIDADKIINHGVNGFIADQTPDDFAKYISILLSDEELRLKMGTEARRTIIEHFNDKDRMVPIYELIKSRFPSAL